MTELKANKQGCGCDGGAECTCTHHQNRSHNVFRTNLSDAKTRRVQYENRETLVVPVVMARADVVMNGSLVPEEEFFPESWNGVPVTVGHPGDARGYDTANTPENLSDWSVGRIFGAQVDRGALKAEAWIDVERAERIKPGLVARLESGINTDVSTGYYSVDEVRSGRINGQAYERISRNLSPDHLALLPDEQGACGWEDGCGVRANRSLKMKVNEAIDTLRSALGMTEKQKEEKEKGKAPNSNERGDDNDRRQMTADLISLNESPFMPDDEDSLRMMSLDTLTTMRDTFAALRKDNKSEDVGKNAGTEGKETNGEQPSGKEKEKQVNTEEKGKQPNGAAEPGGDAEVKLTQKQLDEFVGNAVKKAMGEAISEEDRAAIDRARQINAEHREKLVEKVVANTTIEKKTAEAMDTKTLEIVANGVHPQPNYAGRALPVVNSEDDKLDLTPMSTKPQVNGAKKEDA